MAVAAGYGMLAGVGGWWVAMMESSAVAGVSGSIVWHDFAAVRFWVAASIMESNGRNGL